MTELETLQRAKIYMEKLANGINPLDDTAIPDNEVVNHVRLSRCFFYVADVLRQVIDNGGVATQKKVPKTPFHLPLEQRARFDYSDAPITITEVSERINMLIEKEYMKTLPYRAIRDWLEFLGMLEEVLDSNGKPTKRPTPQGESMGIILEGRTGPNGPYFVTAYQSPAQHFIMDNLDAIVEFAKAQKENQGQPWTQEHDRCLTDLYQKGVSINEIAITLKRNDGAIRKRLKKLNLLQWG